MYYGRGEPEKEKKKGVRKMNATNVVFGKEAVQALYLATRPSPNCGKWEGNHRQEDFIREGITFNELILPIFRQRPMLLSQLFQRLKSNEETIKPFDIASFYCLDHQPFVAGFKKDFHLNGLANFGHLVENNFSLNEGNLADFLFACMGRVGKIIFRAGRRVSIDCSLGRKRMVIRNAVVVLPPGTRYVALHFASCFAVLSEEQYREIQRKQLELPAVYTRHEIDYEHWLGNDLTEFTLKTLGLL